MGSLPQLTGKQLRRLLEKDNWVELRNAKHGTIMVKEFEDGHRRRTTIQKKRGKIPEGTLRAILSDKQTGLGVDGLMDLLAR